MYLFIEKRYPFHISISGSLVVIFMKGLVNKLIKPQRAPIQNIIIKGPFEYLNDGFPYPIIHLGFYIPEA